MSDELFRMRGSGALVASTLGGDTGNASSPGSLVGSSGLVYRPLRQLGEGGMARVFLACALGGAGFSKLVVLKMMRRYLEATEYRDMFLQEAQLCARLNHPNLVQVYEVVENDGAPFLVMEYLEGKPLTELRRLDAIPRDMVLTVLCEALLGLHQAHELADFDGSLLQIVHRDVSPHNIFVTYEGAIKVLDFGVAKTSASEGQTRNGEIKGKLSYMSPEQFLGEAIDRRADVFSMGAVLWELMIGTPLWDKADQPVMVQRLAMGDIPRPNKRANLDPELEAIIVRATAAAPEDRYATALEMHGALSAYRERRPKVYTPREVGRALGVAFETERATERTAIQEAIAEALAVSGDSERPTNAPVEEQATAEEQALIDEIATARPQRGSLQKRWPLILAAVAATVLGFAALKGGTPAAAPVPAPQASAAAASVPSARLVFHVRPVGARVEIDGVLRGSGNFEWNVPVDASEHRVVASAKDHEPTSRLIKFDGNQQIEIELVVTPEKPAGSTESTANRGAKGRSRAGAHLGTPAKPLTPAGSATPSGNLCATPYFFKDGIKTFRPECL